MKASITISSREFKIDFSQAHDISIPIKFNGEQPNTYGVDIATAKPYRDDNFVGDTREGGPCNFETYSITPHCNGTHTESIGHITKERVSILSSLKDVMIPSTLISLAPKSSFDSYKPTLNKEDLVISKQDIYELIDNTPSYLLEALIIRTHPNNDIKKSQNYMKSLPSFFSIDAMKYIKSKGVKHLLVDTPSVDRLFDEGNLSAHNIFWDTIDKKFNPLTKNHTITEMIFVDNTIADGSYLLNLQIPAFIADAAPSRPIIFKLYDI